MVPETGHKEEFDEKAPYGYTAAGNIRRKPLKGQTKKISRATEKPAVLPEKDANKISRNTKEDMEVRRKELSLMVTVSCLPFTKKFKSPIIFIHSGQSMAY